MATETEAKNKPNSSSNVFYLLFMYYRLITKRKGNMHQIVKGYGWNDGKGWMSFRYTTWGQSPRSFCVVNDSNRIIIHNEGADSDPGIIPPHWTHDSPINTFIPEASGLMLSWCNIVYKFLKRRRMPRGCETVWSQDSKVKKID